MPDHVHFIEAFCGKLAEDTGSGGLVDLTGHDPLNPDRGVKIGRMNPNLRERYPYIGIELRSDRLLSDGSVPELQKSRVRIRVCSCGDSADYVILRIGDRIENLLMGKVGPGAPAERTNNWFWDFSDENISIKSTGFFSRSKIFEEDDADTRCQNILVDVIWHNTPC